MSEVTYNFAASRTDVSWAKLIEWQRLMLARDPEMQMSAVVSPTQAQHLHDTWAFSNLAPPADSWFRWNNMDIVLEDD